MPQLSTWNLDPTRAATWRNACWPRPPHSKIFGDMWLQGQRRYWLDFVGCGDVFGEPRIHLGITFFGDPSLRLERIPAASGELTVKGPTK
jgi:hypothetical protein